jgi:hypothetical protein
VVYTFTNLRNVTKEATVATSTPVKSRYPEATQTESQPKNLVNVSKGATLVSIKNLKVESNPVANPQPIRLEKIPSSKNGSWIENEDAPTNFITPVSRRRLKAAIRIVLEMRRAAVKTLAKPISNAPFRKTFSKRKNFSKIAR